MIRSWANSPSRLVYEQGRPRFPSLQMEAAQDLLAALDTVSDLSQLQALRGAGLRPLEIGPGTADGRGARWAVAAGDRAWICFRFERGHAFEVDVVERLGIWPR